MKAPPDGLRPGEHALQHVGGLLTVLVGLRQLSGAFGVALGLGVLASVACGCAGLYVTPLAGGLACGTGLLLSIAAAGTYAAVKLRLPGEWVVTTERLVHAGGGAITEIPVADIVDVDVLPRTSTVTVTTAKAAHTFQPVAGLEHLWGALVFARAWRPGALEVADTVTVHPMLAWMAMERTSTVHVRGVLVLRPGTIAWIPERLTRKAPDGDEIVAHLAAHAVGLRLDRVHALPPIARVFQLLQSLRDPARFDDEVARVIAGWGGWVHPPADLPWALVPGLLGTAVELALDGKRYVANGVSRSADWPAIEAAWKAARAE